LLWGGEWKISFPEKKRGRDLLSAVIVVLGLEKGGKGRAMPYLPSGREKRIGSLSSIKKEEKKGGKEEVIRLDEVDHRKGGGCLLYSPGEETINISVPAEGRKRERNKEKPTTFPRGANSHPGRERGGGGKIYILPVFTPGLQSLFSACGRWGK